MNCFLHSLKRQVWTISRKTSFKEQMFRTLNSLNRFGQSKYQAKQESYRQGNKGKVEGIYSKKTMQDYKKVAEQFQSWAKSKGYHFHSLCDVSDAHIKQYLTERQTEGRSAWTVSHDLSALNKIFHREITKKDAGLQARHNSNIKNNRGFGNNYRTSVYQRNEAMTSFLSATGIRRQSITTISPADAIRNNQGTVIGFHVVEKGGKHRNCYVIKGKQADITSFVDKHLSNRGNTPFWNKVDKNLNTHWYRGEYANALYNDLIIARNNRQDYFEGYRDTFVNASKLEQATSGHGTVTKGYDTECLAVVSQNLGHNRIDVVYTNYLSRY